MKKQTANMNCPNCNEEMSIGGKGTTRYYYCDNCDKKKQTTDEEELKLFVWEGDGVLTDYTNGMVCVLAHNFEEAIKLIDEKGSYYLQNIPINKYKIITIPEAFLCYGGG